MTDELKSCPVCGGNNVGYKEVFDFKCCLYCKNCGYHTRWHLQSVKGAIKEWNAEYDKKLETL